MTMEELEQQLKPLMLMGLAGDSAAQQQLLERCAERLRAYYRRRLPGREHDVEDLVQESLIAIHRRRASYDTRLPFTAWLHAIARYKLVDQLRAHYRKRTVPLTESAEWIEVEFDAPELGVACDVDRLLAGLPHAQREAIRLTKLEGLSIAEAAARTGHSQSNIKVLAHRGMKAMMAETRKMERQ
jgi:RNA polymerase sigma-70 factor (ECF subfamily)